MVEYIRQMEFLDGIPNKRHRSIRSHIFLIAKDSHAQGAKFGLSLADSRVKELEEALRESIAVLNDHKEGYYYLAAHDAIKKANKLLTSTDNDKELKCLSRSQCQESDPLNAETELYSEEQSIKAFKQNCFHNDKGWCAISFIPTDDDYYDEGQSCDNYSSECSECRKFISSLKSF